MFFAGFKHLNCLKIIKIKVQIILAALIESLFITALKIRKTDCIQDSVRSKILKRFTSNPNHFHRLYPQYMQLILRLLKVSFRAMNDARLMVEFFND